MRSRLSSLAAERLTVLFRDDDRWLPAPDAAPSTDPSNTSPSVELSPAGREGHTIRKDRHEFEAENSQRLHLISQRGLGQQM